MESKTNQKKWITLLLTAIMSISLLFGATACNDNDNNNNNNNDVVVVPDDDDGSESPSATE